MYILINDSVVSSSDVIEAIIRTDCVPIPLSVELLIKYSQYNDDLFKQGAEFTIGSQGYVLEVIQKKRKKSALVQDDTQYGVIGVTAILSGCKNVGYLKNRAIILNDTSLGAIYRACGATAKISSDFTAPKFSCLIGETPTKSIAIVTQEEGGIICYKNNKITFLRLEDLFKQDPVLDLDLDTLDAEDSGFIERHLSHGYFSTKPDGALASGNFTKERGRVYVARTNERVLYNLSKFLVTKRDTVIGFNPSINAGDCIRVNGLNMAVVTAAHYYAGESSSEANQYSRLWLGVLEK